MTDETFEDQRRRMVKRQLVARGLCDRRVLDAMRRVPREEFVPVDGRELAYEDTPLRIEAGQTISQPYVVALMIEALSLIGDERVLEVGAGSGYAAAVLSLVAREVIAVERIAELARLAQARMDALGFRNVRIACGDGTLGWERHAPYDAILVSAGGPEAPPSLLRELAVGGRLVIPVGRARHRQRLLRIRRTGADEFAQEALGRVRFVPLIGSEGW